MSCYCSEVRLSCHLKTIIKFLQSNRAGFGDTSDCSKIFICFTWGIYSLTALHLKKTRKTKKTTLFIVTIFLNILKELHQNYHYH